MRIDTIVILYVIGLLLAVCISLLKNKLFTAIPIIVSSIIFIITKEENWYYLAFYQVVVCFISVTTQNIIRGISQKKRNSEIDKTKIKDLM